MNNYISDIKQILAEARQRAYAAINSAMVEAYWKVGERIVLQEQGGESRAAYGEQVLKELSIALTAEFGKGFSAANLRNMRQFYLTYPDVEKCYALRSKLSWTHHRLIMRVENAEARDYYIREATENNWSSRLLERNINTFYYQRLLSSQNKSLLPVKASEQMQLGDFIKDPYILEFLDIDQPLTASERQIETAIIDKLQHFLLELGKGFSFVGRQYRISSELEHYYIDLVFYNYILKCFVLIDLKITKLSHQDIGQMDMYRRMFDDLRKPEGDNPTIGIILCADKSETVVKYSVLNDNPQMFATKFMPYLPTEEELIAEIDRNKIEKVLQGE
jgi:predicted nuclease of restriction endonuclease-like (RecB) superfamily